LGQFVHYGDAVLIDGLRAVDGVGLVEYLAAVEVVEAQEEYDSIGGEREALVVEPGEFGGWRPTDHAVRDEVQMVGKVQVEQMCETLLVGDLIGLHEGVAQ